MRPTLESQRRRLGSLRPALESQRRRLASLRRVLESLRPAVESLRRWLESLRPALESQRTRQVVRSRRAQALAVAVLVLAAGWWFPSGRDLGVTMSVQGRSAVVPGANQVAGLLHEMHVPQPRGTLYSAVTHRALGANVQPVVRVDGRPASLQSTVRGGSHVVVEQGTAVEPTITAYVLASAPFARGLPAQAVRPDAPPATWDGAPDVMDQLWRPGRPPLRQVALGSVSGEQLADLGTVPGVAAAPEREPQVALTIDDGPDPAWTPQVLKALRDQNVPATFCLIGGPPAAGPEEGSVAANPDLVRQEVAQGGTLCNHTMDHDEHLDQRPAPAIAANLAQDTRLITQAAGVRPAYYRPPGGTLSSPIIASARALDMRVLTWTIDTSDFERQPAATQLQTVLGQIQPGAMILLHDGGGDRSQTLALLPQLITSLRQRGYGFTTPALERAPAPPPLPRAGAALRSTARHQGR